jgi:hypothetical protein
VTPYVTRCRGCGAELRHEDAVAGWCAAPRCAEAAASLSPAGRLLLAEYAERERIVAAVDREYIDNHAIADYDEAQKISNERKTKREYYD